MSPIAWDGKATNANKPKTTMMTSQPPKCSVSLHKRTRTNSVQNTYFSVEYHLRAEPAIEAPGMYALVATAYTTGTTKDRWDTKRCSPIGTGSRTAFAASELKRAFKAQLCRKLEAGYAIVCDIEGCKVGCPEALNIERAWRTKHDARVARKNAQWEARKAKDDRSRMVKVEQQRAAYIALAAKQILHVSL